MQIRILWFFSFPVCIPFIFFSIGWFRTPIQWIAISRVSCSWPSWGCLEFLPIWHYDSYFVIYMACITLTYVCSTHAPSRVLIIKECWSLTKFSFCIFWSDMWFLPLSPFMWWIIFIALHMLNHLWIPGLIPTWSWLMIFWMCYSIWFVSIYWGFLHVQRLACNFCCYCCVFIWFWYWGHNGFMERGWTCFSFLCLMDYFQMLWC